MNKFPATTLLLSFLTVGIFILFGEAPEALSWQSDHLQIWQLISAHFAHISTQHLIWNIVAFTVLGSIIEQHSTKRLIQTLLVGCFTVNLYLFTLFKLPAYAGLSGALNTLLIVALYQVSKVPGYGMAACLSLIMSLAKLAYEWSSGNTLLTSLAWPSVPAAHCAGLLGGILLCLLLPNNKLNNNMQKLSPI